MAWRNEPGPASALLVTMRVAAGEIPADNSINARKEPVINAQMRGLSEVLSRFHGSKRSLQPSFGVVFIISDGYRNGLKPTSVIAKPSPSFRPDSQQK